MIHMIHPEGRHMAQAQIYEGTPDQLVMQFSKLPKTHRYKVTIIAEEPQDETVVPSAGNGHLYFGMFSGEPEVTEEDFKLAEWHGEDIEI
jgi:hypothetical protein